MKQQCLIRTMPRVNSKPRRSNKYYNVDDKWVANLIGLRLKVKVCWFNNIERHERNKWFGGIIYCWDNDECMWKLSIDLERNLKYLIRYDSVLKYVDEDAANFHEFQLPELSVAPPAPAVAMGATLYTKTKEIDWAQVFEDT